jgi:hypothetical protein
MGVKLEVSAPIDMPAKKFWEVRNTQEYLNIECELLGMKTKECVDLEYWDNGNIQACKLKARPDLSHVPPSILRVVGNADPIFVDICEFPEYAKTVYHALGVIPERSTDPIQN